ncbi:helix-turn-helix domain-containing protein [Neorhizobium sp. T786]|uniref:helix-turn-helix domain-containing protein n=1 Tax=Pseudorhizobium xiangyangii TaxID=2883104 RepID=UPI001CFF9948|nr:helix-turn-helix domain-containing protein [Neorhizobium xiangyangii]MCB5203263.1 helix-turn-helix domain-containing protein [Neorhizobium xiangyangii]
MSEHDLLTPAEAAGQLRISERQLRDLTDDGLLRWINVGRGKKRAARRYAQQDIDEFKEKQAKTICRSTNVAVKKPTRTISSSGTVDFLAILAQRKSETQKASKTTSGR